MEPKDLRTIVFFQGIVSAQILRRASLAQDDIVVTALQFTAPCPLPLSSTLHKKAPQNFWQNATRIPFGNLS